MEPQTIYCAACEHPCSPAAATCPQCGHPLATPQRPLVVVAGTPRWALLAIAISILVAGVGWYLNRPRPVDLRLPQTTSSPALTLNHPRLQLPISILELTDVLSSAAGWLWHDRLDLAADEKLWLIENENLPGLQVIVRGKYPSLHAVAAVLEIPWRDAAREDDAAVGTRVAVPCMILAHAVRGESGVALSAFREAFRVVQNYGHTRQREIRELNDYHFEVHVSVDSERLQVHMAVVDDTVQVPEHIPQLARP